MGLEPLEYSKLQEIHISDYGKHVNQYVSTIEEKLANSIKFFDTGTHPHPFERKLPTRFDLPRALLRGDVVVWINMDDLRETPCPDTHLAHEATHAELTMLENYPFPVCLNAELWERKFNVVELISSMLQDLIVEGRLADFRLDESEDVKYKADKVLSEEEAGTHPPPTDVEPDFEEVVYAIEYASYFLSRYCKGRLKRRLRKACKAFHTACRAYVKHIVDIVKNTSHILEPEGQGTALRQITMIFGLDKIYVLKTARDWTPGDCPP